MALPATLHRFEVSLVHVDRGIDQRFPLSAARHPSETVERLWLRVLALAWQWQEGIAFGPGLCDPDAPDLVAPAPGGGLSLAVRVGKPDPDRVDRDLTRNQGARVAALFDSPRRMEAFLDEARARGLSRIARAELAAADGPFLARLAAVDDRRLRVAITIADDHLYVEAGGASLDGPLHRGSF
jgi:uncharacterized protein YaeQ